jgi:hypothetical protein
MQPGKIQNTPTSSTRTGRLKPHHLTKNNTISTAIGVEIYTVYSISKGPVLLYEVNPHASTPHPIANSYDLVSTATYKLRGNTQKPVLDGRQRGGRAVSPEMVNTQAEPHQQVLGPSSLHKAPDIIVQLWTLKKTRI